ncbi:MAG: hypothetical protein ABSC53_10720 [Bacteroidota bacterium]
MMKTKDPEEIFINDAKLVCNQCEFDQFYTSKYNPSKDGLNFIGLDWMSTSVDVFICSRCGFFHWFASTLPSEIPVSSLPSETSKETVIPEMDPYKLSGTSECISCGKVIPEGLDHCPSCGWTYK